MLKVAIFMKEDAVPDHLLESDEILRPVLRNPYGRTSRALLGYLRVMSAALAASSVMGAAAFRLFYWAIRNREGAQP
jgi:hypothetical protein